jgi:N-acetylglucosaminyldiphosphoundecaprenol N-acetyl-beta-D-mannosaminyltransferase
MSVLSENTSRPARRVNVLGVGISAINLDSAVAFISQALRQRTKGYVCVTGVHGVSEAQNDAEFRQILNNAMLNTPDGMPMVWMGRLQGFRAMARVYGPDLMLRLCATSLSEGFTHFLYGGQPGVAEQLKSRLESRFPGIKIIGTYSPPFRPLTTSEEADLISRLSTLQPDLFWVGLSTPKQEKFMAAYSQKLAARIFLGVGAAFDFHAGRVPQAPAWMQHSGLEWLFRLAREPRRLWKRYLKNNPLFLIRAFCQLTRLKAFPLE